jgi:hypothetical protein
MFEVLKKIWHDPVWSKVIAAAIIAISAAIVAALIKFKSLLAFAIWAVRLLTSCVPCWAILITLIVIALLLPYWWRAFRKKKSQIYIAWHDSAGWGIGGLLQKDGIEQVLRLQGPVFISSSQIEEPVIVTRIELKEAEYAGPNFQVFEVKPGETARHTLLLNFRGVTPAKHLPFKAHLTLVDIKGHRYPLKPAILRAFPGEEAFPSKEEPAVLTAGDSLVIDSTDKFSLRITKFDSGGARGVQIQIENDRLELIHQTRVILSSATSWDSGHEAYRESTLAARTFNRPDVIGSRGTGKAIPLVWKAADSAGLVTGESNIRYPLIWPERDKADIEKWKLSLRVLAFVRPTSSQEQSTPLRELNTEIVVLWNRGRNEFSIEKSQDAPIPANLPAAFPLDGKDGAHRQIASYIMCGPDQLLAYRTTREGMSGTRFLVVRMRPSGDPQSVETPDREAANFKWNEWYQEWKQRGFGGTSGNGLDGMPPF